MKKIALVRGKFLTKYDMEPFESLSDRYEITAYGSLSSDLSLKFPLEKLPGPMDLPNFPYKMPVLNRVFIDAHYLFGLEDKLKGFDMAHTAETYFHFTQQCLNAKKKGYVKKVLITVLENIPFNNENIWGRKAFKRRAIEEADHFIAATKGARDALIAEGVSQEKISVIGLSVNSERFKPDGRYNTRQLNNDNISLLFVGRLEEFKGVLDVLDAFIATVRKIPKKKILLNIIGNGSRRIELDKKVREHGIGKDY